MNSNYSLPVKQVVSCSPLLHFVSSNSLDCLLIGVYAHLQHKMSTLDW